MPVLKRLSISLLAALLLLFSVSMPMLAGVPHYVTLSWNDTVNPTGTTYTIYQYNGATGGACPATAPIVGPPPAPWASIKTGNTTVSYDVNPIRVGTYCWVVTAVLNGSESVPSNMAASTVPPQTPTSVTVSPTGPGNNVTITWASGAGQTGETFTVYNSMGLCSGTINWSKIQSGITTTSLMYSALPGAQCFSVTSTLLGIESPQSSIATITTPTASPTAVTVTLK